MIVEAADVIDNPQEDRTQSSSQVALSYSAFVVPNCGGCAWAESRAVEWVRRLAMKVR